MKYCKLYLYLSIVAIVVLMVTLPICAQQPGEVFTSWTEGHLDIHHINTARGDAAFFILPDGTTMLVDAGAIYRESGGPRYVEAKPDDSRSPGEWISRYISHMLRDHEEQRIHYMLITHFHPDHMGGIYPGPKISESGRYQLTGITEVGEHIPFDKVIDRGWPDYNWPTPLESDMMNNYRQFLQWQIENNHFEVEQFQPGVNDQITLSHRPDEYPNFEIRNVAVNGVVWTGVHNNVRNHFPPVEELEPGDYPPENACSIVFRLSYGNFDYYTGGDLIGIPHPGRPSWHDVETPVAKAVGPVDVHVLNHHGVWDAQNDLFLKTLRPRVHIVQAWGIGHLTMHTIRRLFSEELNAIPGDVFSTNTPDLTRNYIGSRINQLKSQQGHIVIRVNPEGNEYNIFILDDSEENFKVTAIHGPYHSR